MTGGAVVETHDAFDDCDVGAAGTVQEQRLDQLFAAQVGIEVAARSPGGQLVVAGVDEVRSHLVSGHGEATTAQRGH